jgi:uncharacterized protein
LAARYTELVSNLKLDLLPDRLAVCRLAGDAGIPEWAGHGAGFYSVTRAPGELSVVCAEGAVPNGVKHDGGWRVFQIEGPFDFGVVGILVSAAAPLADAGVPIFAVSTFDTDYVLVKEDQVERAVLALENSGHQVRSLGAG